jgi:hypothetical protein
MALARATLRLGEDSPLREQSFISESGELCAWLDVGADGEFSVYGSPAALRRLGTAMLAAADAADELAERHEYVDPGADAGV